MPPGATNSHKSNSFANGSGSARQTASSQRAFHHIVKRCSGRSDGNDGDAENHPNAAWQIALDSTVSARISGLSISKILPINIFFPRSKMQMPQTLKRIWGRIALIFLADRTQAFPSDKIRLQRLIRQREGPAGLHFF